MQTLLRELEITETNRGTCSGADGWISENSGAELVSINPTNGQLIASVQRAGSQSYERLIEQAVSSFAQWRERPCAAPRTAGARHGQRDAARALQRDFHQQRAYG